MYFTNTFDDWYWISLYVFWFCSFSFGLFCLISFVKYTFWRLWKRQILHAVPIIRVKQNGYDVNIVNSTEINFSQHRPVWRIQPYFILVYACFRVSISIITSVDLICVRWICEWLGRDLIVQYFICKNTKFISSNLSKYKY